MMHLSARSCLLAAFPALWLMGCAAAPSDANDTAAKDAAGADDGGNGAVQNPSPAPMAATGWLSIGGDGAVQTTFFDADGRYRDWRNGAQLASGNWTKRSDGRICFEPDAGLGDCWKIDPPDKNGEAIATDSEGKSIAIRQVTYIAPAEPAEPAAPDASPDDPADNPPAN